MNKSKQIRPAFWDKPLSELSTPEWELLCDGCGRCCLSKLCDDYTGKIHYTRVICRYFNTSTSRCGCYEKRRQLVPDCVVLDRDNIADLDWMPDTCAYRLRHEGRPLYHWHPLLAGSRDKMEEAGITLTGKVISEEHVPDAALEEHIIRWVKAESIQ
ncbi:MAG: YcgN family cysteine cluster protein [Pseudohongiellaceae bacterium]